ncbi:MAG: nitrilase-related carbon-nitrogen hydrolase, partial [Candidatus Omnitrophota bacterium]|nr:nitrilase-related carbon-nitrogen hydrolase [Candidatus Omnitrophota bacterium]
MKIAIAQINPIVGDFKNNARKITEHADRAKALGCGLIVFSELVISGYPPRDLLEKEDFITANRTCLEQLTASITGIGVICGVVEKNTSDQGNSLYNSAILFEDGKTLHRIHKRLLPNYDIFDERRYFEPGAHCTVYPYGGRRIGLTVCEDLWNDKDIFKRRMYALDPAALMAQEGADLIINISASPFHAGKQAFRSRMIQSIAAKYRIPLIFANQVGGNDSILFDGLSAAYDQTGKLVARARDFEEDLVMLNLSDPGALQPATGDIHPVSGSDAEATLKALIMGTRDYVRKCGF